MRYTLQLKAGDAEGRSRQVVKSDSATIRVPELDFEIPAATQKGTISTVEGLLSDAASNLRCALAPVRSTLISTQGFTTDSPAWLCSKMAHRMLPGRGLCPR